MIAGLTAALFAILVSWVELDWPRPAMNMEVAQVEQFAIDTREIVLNQEWFKIQEDMIEVNRLISQDPTNPAFQEWRLKLRAQQRAVNQQLKELHDD